MKRIFPVILAMAAILVLSGTAMAQGADICKNIVVNDGAILLAQQGGGCPSGFPVDCGDSYCCSSEKPLCCGNGGCCKSGHPWACFSNDPTQRGCYQTEEQIQANCKDGFIKHCQ